MIIIPEIRTHLIEPRYCPVSPRYITYESAYSILSRFSLYNVIQGHALVKIFAPTIKSNQNKRNRVPSLANNSSINPSALREYFRLDGSQRDALFLVPTAIPSGDHLASTLRVCPICLVRGVHYSIFQYMLIKQCPIHEIDLTQVCRNCGGAMDYSLNCRLFHAPYSCCHCGKLLLRKQSQNERSYLNKFGIERLNFAHRIFAQDRGRKIYFDVNQPTNVYFDNSTQFSSAIKDFAVHQQELFAEVQSKVLSGQGKQSSSFYRIDNTRRCSPIAGQERDFVALELIPILKSIFRHIRRRFILGVKLSKNRLTGMWRSIEAVEVPREGYKSVAYLDWLCFWYDVQAPADLLSRANRCVNRKLSTWLEAKRAHAVFTSLQGTREKNWLIIKILALEITFFIVRQTQFLRADALRGGETSSTSVVYHRAVGPAAWALVVLPDVKNCELHFSAHSSFSDISHPYVSALEHAATTTSLSH